ncbi:hypothetical protein [Colwellia maritima]|nr:hypothetical protein [Colwellia maritima]
MNELIRDKLIALPSDNVRKEILTFVDICFSFDSSMSLSYLS